MASLRSSLRSYVGRLRTARTVSVVGAMEEARFTIDGREIRNHGFAVVIDP